MTKITICSDFGAQKIKSDTVSPSNSHEMMGPEYIHKFNKSLCPCEVTMTSNLRYKNTAGYSERVLLKVSINLKQQFQTHAQQEY